MNKVEAYQCQGCKTLHMDREQCQQCEDTHSYKLVVKSAEFSKNKPLPTGIEVECLTANKIDVIWYYR